LSLIEREDNQIILSVALGHIQGIYWSFLPAETRMGFAPKVEAVLWTMMAEAQDPAVKKLLYRRYANMALSESGIRRLNALWSEALFVDKLTLSEADKIALAGILSVKAPVQADVIVAAQSEAIQNPDRKRRFDFIKPALSADQGVRDAFFESLKDAQNREVESWVLAALRYLHHPLRTNVSEKYLFDSLELLAEIQRTGDIFFPARWTASTLGTYQSETAVKTVREFLRDRPDYNYQLKLKILQSADTLFRADKVLKANGDT
jgi:aminopeptidase N